MIFQPRSKRFWGCVISSMILFIHLKNVHSESTTSFRGYAEGRYYFFEEVLDYNYGFQHRLRPELILYWDDISITTVANVSKNFGLWEEQDSEGFNSGFSLERLYLDYTRGLYDLRLGKQAINFGSAQIWNPVNFIDANSPLDFNVEKKGIYAVRLRRMLNELSQIFLIVSYPDEDNNETLSLLGTNAIYGSMEFKMFIGDDRLEEEYLYGLDIKGDLVVGYWVEAAYHQKEHEEENNEDYYSYVLGLDYSFPIFETTYISLQYHEDSSGATDVEDYDFIGLASGERTFLGRRYFSIMCNVTFSEDYSCGLTSIINHHDRSILVNPVVTGIFRENWTITLGATMFTGSEPGEFNPVDDYLLAGNIPENLFYCMMKYNF